MTNSCMSEAGIDGTPQETTPSLERFQDIRALEKDLLERISRELFNVVGDFLRKDSPVLEMPFVLSENSYMQEIRNGRYQISFKLLVLPFEIPDGCLSGLKETVSANARDLTEYLSFCLSKCKVIGAINGSGVILGAHNLTCNFFNASHVTTSGDGHRFSGGIVEIECSFSIVTNKLPEGYQNMLGLFTFPGGIIL